MCVCVYVYVYIYTYIYYIYIYIHGWLGWAQMTKKVYPPYEKKKK
jgi:hypothetical protein